MIIPTGVRNNFSIRTNPVISTANTSEITDKVETSNKQATKSVRITIEHGDGVKEIFRSGK